MKKGLSILVCSMFFLSGCSALSPKTERKFEFKEILKIKAGSANKAAVTHAFGKPDEIKGEYWDYKEGKFTRLSFFFPEGSNVVDTVSWEIFEGDKEQNLNTSLNLFPGAKWKVTTREWVYSVGFRKVRKEVYKIWWWDTSRRPANSAKEKRSACPNGDCKGLVHRDEWLRTSNWPLCEVPK